MLECLSGETRLYPILGDPITAVQSPQTLTRGFEARGHNGICVPMQVPQPDLVDVMHGLAPVPNVDGLLITMPHKFAAFRLCASSSERAKLLGVVSVIRRNPDGARVLLVGAGGAGSAIAIALLEAGVRELIIHDSDEARAAHLIELLSSQGGGRVNVGPPDPASCDMVCNATPLGMTAGDPLPVPANALTPSMFVGDVIAGHGLTPLVQAARAAGCKTATGVQMVEAVQEMMLDFFLRK
jgi:shikimate dehydrogenase